MKNLDTFYKKFLRWSLLSTSISLILIGFIYCFIWIIGADPSDFGRFGTKEMDRLTIYLIAWHLGTWVLSNIPKNFREDK